MSSAAARPTSYLKPTSSHDPTEEFLEYFAACQARGTKAEYAGKQLRPEAYLPEDAQLRYFTLARIRSILKQLFPDQKGPGPIDPRQVRGHYRKILATLLYIGKGKLIHTFASNP